MKRFLSAGAVALAAFTSSPASAQINTTTISTPLNTPTYSLMLMAIPANQVAFGSPVALSVRLMVLPANTVAATPVALSRLRVTFKAQMTSPCPGMSPITIATNSPSTASWNAPKGGTYAITAHVVPDLGATPISPKVPQIADVTMNYTVTGGPPLPSNLPYASFISTPVVPASGGATAPADVTITANLSALGYSAIYKLMAGCETAGGSYLPCTSTPTTYYSSVPVTFPLHLAASGQYLLAINGLVFRQSDCQATAVVYTHTNPYIVH